MKNAKDLTIKTDTCLCKRKGILIYKKYLMDYSIDDCGMPTYKFDKLSLFFKTYSEIEDTHQIVCLNIGLKVVDSPNKKPNIEIFEINKTSDLCSYLDMVAFKTSIKYNQKFKLTPEELDCLQNNYLTNQTVSGWTSQNTVEIEKGKILIFFDF